MHPHPHTPRPLHSVLPLVRTGLILLGLALIPAQAQSVTSLNASPWQVAMQPDVKDTGEQISAAGYSSKQWLTAQVPGTAFGAYVIAGIEKEPSYGENAYLVDQQKYYQNYWYRTEFKVPAAYTKGGRIWLNLDGVHRDADVYFNGTKLGVMQGFLQRGRFDVTTLVKREGGNSLAVLAYHMVLLDGKNTGNSTAPAVVCSRGWDWMPRVPGFNTGIYKDVYLSHTGEVSLIDPWVRSTLPNHSAADISIQTELANSATTAVTGELVGEINPGKIPFSKSVTLQPGVTQTVTLTAAEISALHINNPKLWWPNGYGDPNLYTCQLEFRTGGAVSDHKDVTFGIKKYTYEIDSNILYFRVNGTRVFLKGGNWGAPEFMLRNRTASDYDTRVRFHKELNFNVIRNWMGAVPDEEFYQACDKYGIMVWDEFWTASKGGLPADLDIYFANAREKVKQVRNHPSIAFWCCQNEGTPEPELNNPLRDIIKIYDGDDRCYQGNSCDDKLSGSGPWHALDPRNYFTGVPTQRGEEQPYGLRSELGIGTFTSFDSFKKFMPKEAWWPARNPMWARHFTSNMSRPHIYFHQISERYGEPTNIEDQCLKAQLHNLESMKAMYEGWLDHSDTNSSGIIIWMGHPAYPAFVWQTYDYYYDTTGAYWGAKSACEPVHIYWNCSDDRIRVVNTTGQPVEALRAELWIYNMDGTEQGHQTATISAPCDKVADCFKLTTPAGLSPTHFLKLHLTDAAGRLVSENSYWRGTTALDYFGLSAMKPVKLAVAAPTSEVLASGMSKMSVAITNPANSGTVAFAIRPKPVIPSTGEQVLPVYMNDGYFTLMPGETKAITMEYHPRNTNGEKPQLVVECWNNTPHPTPTKPAPLPPEPIKKPAPPPPPSTTPPPTKWIPNPTNQY